MCTIVYGLEAKADRTGFIVQTVAWMFMRIFACFLLMCKMCFSVSDSVATWVYMRSAVPLSVEPERIWKWGGSTHPEKFGRTPPLSLFWLYKYIISSCSERFRDGQYSLVSFLFAVLLTVPPCPMESAPLLLIALWSKQLMDLMLILLGLFFIIPCTDTYTKVDLRTVSFDVPPQEVIQQPLNDLRIISPHSLSHLHEITQLLHRLEWAVGFTTYVINGQIKINEINVKM